MSQAILILGMHRSGTSAVTRVCNVLGANLGRSVIDAGPDNPKGYWENQDVVDLHDKMLRELNHPWDSVSPLPDNWWLGKDLDWARTSIRDIIARHFTDKLLWALKDPRMCLLLPLWLEVLGEQEIEVKCLIVRRDPEDIARSLSVRDGLGSRHACLLYIRHILEVERQTRNPAVTRAVVSYDALLENWYPVTQSFTEKLGINWPEKLDVASPAVASELELGLRHHKHQTSPDRKSRDLELLAMELNAALETLDDSADTSAFDAVIKKLKRMEANAAAWLEVIGYQNKFVLEHSKLESIRKTQSAEIEKLGVLQKENRKELVKLDRLRRAQFKELELLEGLRIKDTRLITRLDKLKEKLSKELVFSESENEKRKFVIASQQEEIDVLKLEATGLRATVEEIYASKSWHVTAPMRWMVTRFLVTKHQLSVFGYTWFTTGLAKEMFRTAWLNLRKLGPAEFLRRLPLYMEYVQNYKMRSTPPRIITTANTVRMIPAAYNPFDLASVDKPLLTHANLRPHPALRNDVESIDASVSVIIPTYNAGEEFYWLLRKLTAQKGLGKLEVVIVDSGSTDTTVDLARGAGCVVVEITQTQFSHSYARNLGAENASGDYLLFIVQDAYPVGDLWTFGMLSYLLDHRDDNVVAVSCSEYCRSDSDIMYDCNVDTHYRFLRCRENDRIGEFKGADHMSLRSWGQLSDVSCMLSKELFSRYEYRGDYAEDLDLGIRLIRDNYRIAMLASVKTIHSHNRPAYYYLKRSFVDVIFLVRQFEDFTTPPIISLRGLMFGIVILGEKLSKTLGQFEFGATRTTLEDSMLEIIAEVRKFRLEGLSMCEIELEDAGFAGYVTSLRVDYLDDSPPLEDELKVASAFVDGFIGRLEHFRSFANKIYLQQDEQLRREVFDVLRKTFAATVGSYLGFLFLEFQGEKSATGEAVERIKSVMGAGI